MIQSAESRLEAYIGRYSDETATLARSVLARMNQRLPGAVRLVYDNYNALVIGFGATEKTSGMVFSIAVYPRWVSLFFANGVQLDDPARLLKGAGRRVRHIVLRSEDMLEEPEIVALMEQALVLQPIDPAGAGRLVTKSVSANQRPRRPAGTS